MVWGNHQDRRKITNWQEATGANGVQLTQKELLYYRSKTFLLDLSPSIRSKSTLFGNYIGFTKGRGMEFDEVRHYQPGDDVRAIDWRVTARTGKTHTKLFREEKERPLVLLCDLSPSMYFGSQLALKSVQMAHLAALIAWKAKDRGDKIGALLFNQHTHHELKPQSRQRGVLSLIHHLEIMHANAIPNSEVTVSQVRLEDALHRMRRIAKPGSDIFLLSDFRDLSENAIKHISWISRHCQLTAYIITDPMEHQLPASNSATQLNATDGQQTVRIDLHSKKQHQEYASRAALHWQQVLHRLKKYQVRCIPISAAEPLDKQLNP